MKLYELAQNYQNILELSDNPEVTKEMLEEALKTIEGDFTGKAENICKVIKTIELESKALKEEEDRLNNRRRILENRVGNLKEYLENSMKAVGLTKINGKMFSLGIQKNPPSVDILNETIIPTEYIQITKTISKKEILDVLKNGIKVPGAVIKQTEGLRIR